MTLDSIPFDEQAASFDSRTGLTGAVAAQVALAVGQLSGVANGATLVEIGAGTGEIGDFLAQQNLTYIGLDQSDAMLDEFRARLGMESKARLICADANRHWPVEDGGAQVIFGSRVFHLLDTGHVEKEVLRVANPGGAVFLWGRVVRDENSVSSQMRSRMRELLIEQGLTPRKARQKRDSLLKNLSQHGTLLEPAVAAAWDKTTSPEQSVNSWANKDSMGGIVPPAAVKAAILDELMKWAAKQFGSTQAETVSQEQYILEGVRLAKR